MKSITRVCCVTFVTLFASASLYAAPVSEISYDHDSDTLTLNLEDVYLMDVLKQLSTEIGFELDTQNVTTKELVNFTGKGKSLDVVRKLVGAESAILSRSKIAPYRLNNVILLPSGDEQTNYLPTGSVDYEPVVVDDSVQDSQDAAVNKRRRLEPDVDIQLPDDNIDNEIPETVENTELPPEENTGE